MEVNSPKIIFERGSVGSNKYTFILVTITTFIPLFLFVFRHLSLFPATCAAILLVIAFIIGTYLTIKHNPKIVELNDKQITFYGRPKALTLPALDVIKVHAHENYWNKLTATLKLEIVTANQTIYVTTKWFDFDKLKLLLSHI
jgi:hypothetical protein